MLTYPPLIVQNNRTKLTGLLSDMHAGEAFTFLPSERTPQPLWNRETETLPRLPEPVPSLFHDLNLSDEELKAQFGPQIRQQLADYGYDDEEDYSNPIRRQERLLHFYRQLDSWATEIEPLGLAYLDVNDLLETPWDEAVQTAIINVIQRVSTPAQD